MQGGGGRLGLGVCGLWFRWERTEATWLVPYFSDVLKLRSTEATQPCRTAPKPAIPKAVIPKKTGIHFDFAVAFALAEVTGDDKQHQQLPSASGRVTFFVLPKKVTKERRFSCSRIKSH